MLNHFLTHITAPVQVALIVLSVWKLSDIIRYLRKKHLENKNK